MTSPAAGASPAPTRTETATSTPLALFSPSPTAPVVATSSVLGQWSFRAETGERPLVGNLRFWMEGSELLGAYIGLSGKATRLANLTLAADQIAFDIVGPLGSWHLVGGVSGDRMNGTFQTLTRTISWTAVRQPVPSTATPAPPPPAPTRGR